MEVENVPQPRAGVQSVHRADPPLPSGRVAPPDGEEAAGCVSGNCLRDRAGPSDRAGPRGDPPGVEGRDGRSRASPREEAGLPDHQGREGHAAKHFLLAESPSSQPDPVGSLRIRERHGGDPAGPLHEQRPALLDQSPERAVDQLDLLERVGQRDDPGGPQPVRHHQRADQCAELIELAAFGERDARLRIAVGAAARLGNGVRRVRPGFGEVV